MKLDEAILHAEEVAEGQMKSAEMWKGYPENKYDCHLAKKAYDSCKKCSDEHKQLAEWLRELKAYKEQEPCEDAISRKAAVVQLYHNKTGDDDVDVIIERDIATIHNLPLVTPKQKWIPVSERLPEIGSDVLATYIEDDEIKVGITYYSKRGFYIDTTIAWMPLPKAYREVKEK